MEGLILSIFIIIIAIILDLNCTSKKQRENLIKSDMYIRRLKQCALLRNCDLSNVKDDREG